MTNRKKVRCLVFFSALVYGAILAAGYGIVAGRDMGTYEEYFSQIFRIYPDNPLVMLFRTPGTPLFFGLIYQIGGLIAVKVVLIATYAGIALVVFEVACSISHKWGITALCLFFCNIPFAKWHFAIGSEALQGILLAFWFCFVFQKFSSASRRIALLHGVLVVLLVLTRPNNQVLLISAFLPILNFRIQPARRLILVSLTATTIIVGVSLLALYNYQRYGDFIVARLGNAHLPFYRLYLQNHAISPENGPASKRLNTILEDYISSDPLLTKYKIDREKLYHAATSRLFAHVLAAVHRADGWESDWILLRHVAIEAIFAAPFESFLGYIDQLGEVFYFSDKRYFTLGPLKSTNDRFHSIMKKHLEELRTLGIDPPDEAEMIPAHVWQLQFRPPNYSPNDQTLFGIQFQAKTWLTESPGPLRSLPRWVEYFSILLGPNGLTLLTSAIGIVLGVMARLRDGLPIDMRIPLLVVIVSTSLLSTLMASVQREFRYPYDPLYTVLFVWSAATIFRVLCRNEVK